MKTPPLVIAKALLPWMVLAVALVLATAPAWRVLLLGVHPSLDDLLCIRCLPGTG